MRRLLPLALLTVPLLALVATPAPAATGASYTTVKLAGAVGASEPRATVDRKGVHYVSTNGTSGEEVVYRSTDGVRWTQTTTPPGQTMPTTDVDAVTLPSGRLLVSETDFTGINFITTYSDDQGKTWQTSQGQTLADTDRQWFATGPGNRVYLLFHNLLSGTVQHNMFVATSTDGGATFGVPVPVATPGQQDYLDLQCADSGGPSGISVNQKTGQVYVFFGTRSSPVGGCTAQPVEVNVVAANREWVVTAPASGTTNPLSWTPHLAVDDTAAGKIVGMQLAAGAVDDAGNVYVAYPESVNDYPDYDGAAIKLVHAPADLSRFSTPTVIAPSGGTGNILPLVVAGDAGKLALSWYHGRADKTWVSDSAQVLDALSARPHVVTTQLSPVVVEKGTASSLMGACLSGPTATLNGFACGRSTDVNGIALDPCGRALFTWPAQAGLATDGTYTSKQTGGPTLRSGACVQAASRTTVVTPTTTTPGGTKTTPGPRASSGGALAATGGAPALALAALGLLTGAVVLRRLRTRAS